MQAHFGAVLNTGTVPVKLKELIVVRTSQVNQTPYCLASHTILAKQLGWTGEQLAHLDDWPRRDDFTPAERPPCAWRRPSPATPIRSRTSTSPSCAASTPKERSSSCSAPSASSITSTASTTPSAWNPQTRRGRLSGAFRGIARNPSSILSPAPGAGVASRGVTCTIQYRSSSHK